LRASRRGNCPTDSIKRFLSVFQLSLNWFDIAPLIDGSQRCICSCEQRKVARCRYHDATGFVRRFPSFRCGDVIAATFSYPSAMEKSWVGLWKQAGVVNVVAASHGNDCLSLTGVVEHHGSFRMKSARKNRTAARDTNVYYTLA
jgi:hypothetical protein